MALDAIGELFITDSEGANLVEVTPGPDGLPSDGTVITLSPATSLGGVATEANGDVFSANGGHVHEATPGPDGLLSDGNVSIVAGTGSPGYSVNGGPAAAAELYSPSGLAVDAQGDLFIADTNNNVVERVGLNATVTITPAAPPAVPATVTDVTASTTTTAWNSGQDITFTATVMPQASGGGTPTGTVQFVVDGADMGGPLTLDNTGAASITSNPLSLGLGFHAVSVIYTSNSANFADSTGTLPGGETIYSPTSTSVIASSGRTVHGQLLMLTATVTPQTLGGFITTGTVLFLIDGVDYDAPVPISGGKASMTLNTLPIGVHNVSAVYRSNSVAFSGSSSPLQTTGVGGIGEGQYQFAGGPALDAPLNSPSGVALDTQGNRFIADSRDNAVLEVTNAIITVVAGNGSAGYSGDGGLAADAELNDPTAVAVDGSGDLFIADTGNNVIRKVNAATGLITTVAGGGSPSSGIGNGGPATQAELSNPTSVAVDSFGNLFIADAGNNVIREVSGGVINTVAGGGSPSSGVGDGGPATQAELSNPTGVAVDASGNFYIADAGNNVIREVSGGVINTVAGGGSPSSGIGDGGPATQAGLSNPTGVAVDASGNLYIADAGNNVIREVSGGVITTVAGGGSPSTGIGDGGPATQSELSNPTGIAVDSMGALFIADTGNNVIRVVTGGAINTVAGGGPALTNSTGVAVNAQGDVFSADQLDGVVHEVTPSGVTTTVVTGLNQPSGLAIDANGDLFIAETGSNMVLEVTPGTGGLLWDSPIIVAGNGSSGYSGDGGQATNAALKLPSGLAVDFSGDLFIADSGNNVVREVTPGSDRRLSDGTITTVASSGPWPFSALSNQQSLSDPSGLAVDTHGDLFIADTGNDVVWEERPGPDGLLSDGTMAVVAGNASCCGAYTVDGPATQTSLNGPSGVVVGPQGNLFIENVGLGGYGQILELLPNGIITIVASFGSEIGYAYGPTPVEDFNANLVYTQGLAMDAQGNLFFAQYPGVGLAGYLSLTVLATPANTISTTTTVTASSVTSVAGQSVTFTAAGGAASPGRRDAHRDSHFHGRKHRARFRGARRRSRLVHHFSAGCRLPHDHGRLQRRFELRDQHVGRGARASQCLEPGESPERDHGPAEHGGHGHPRGIDDEHAHQHPRGNRKPVVLLNRRGLRGSRQHRDLRAVRRHGKHRPDRDVRPGGHDAHDQLSQRQRDCVRPAACRR